MSRRQIEITNMTLGTVLAAAAEVADNPWTRFVGLLGRAGLRPGEGLQILPCKSVHCWFMRFTIDVVYLDRDGRVVKTVPRLRPFCYSWGGRRAHSVLELPADTIAATQTAVGDKLAFSEVSR